ncbi:MAG: FAD-dependent oxidoreductase [Desulfobacterales bacterium]|nr:FAD-dependent oxidoreductase [Desulfobacterales bacterium]
MKSNTKITIYGKQDGTRIASRVLEEKIQQAIGKGYRHLEIEALGQHGIAGRLHAAKDETVYVRINGTCGQRTGSMGFPNTTIEIFGAASDDIGWLNAGAEIIIHGNASNGVCNAMAQGRVSVAGNIGARGMTMTKENPRFQPPELWVLGSTGDYFGEFMAGGTAVVCGWEAQDKENVLGYRPLVGMVGGRVFFRGPIKGYSQGDAKMAVITDDEWLWLSESLKSYLARIGKEEIHPKLARRDDWQLIKARSPQEKMAGTSRSMAAFKHEVWDAELGKGGLIGDLSDQDMSHIPVITTGDLRRFVPVWENKKYVSPCQGACPSGIPVQDRWGLVRNGLVDEAVDLALHYTPFPATVCGFLCPNPCMSACTKQIASMPSINVKQLGKASIGAKVPELPEATGSKVAVIGGGPAGISVAWQLRMAGHDPVVFDTNPTLGGKMAAVIPESRIPKEVLDAELSRIREVLPHIHLQQELTSREMERMKGDHDFIVVATGAQKPRMLPVTGKEKMIPGNIFLADAKEEKANPGKIVVIIGAGNSACDAATEAYRCGAKQVTLIDIAEPASFGEEREAAEKAGATFKWPCLTREITDKGVLLEDGEFLEADTVIISIGDVVDEAFLPSTVALGENGYVIVDENGQTTDPAIFAIGDITGLGLITEAIGAGRRAAETIDAISRGEKPKGRNPREVIDKGRMNLAYFDPRLSTFKDLEKCGTECSSCGSCRDCGVCVTVCPKEAIKRVETGDLMVPFEYRVNANRCIGCGFCADACPCGIWHLITNTPLG